MVANLRISAIRPQATFVHFCVSLFEVWMTSDHPVSLKARKGNWIAVLLCIVVGTEWKLQW